MKYIFIALLFITTTVSAGGIPFTTQAVLEDQTIYRSGMLYGLDKGPTGGTYEVFITNAKKLKGKVFSKMNCTVHKQLATPMAAKFKNSVTMTTVYFEKDGSINTATGYMAGIASLPTDNYTVNVNNRAKNGIWNLLKCTIK